MKQFILVLLVGVISIAYAQKKKVTISYKQEGVTVILDNDLIGTNPSLVKVDFELSKSIVFYKRGFYAQRLEIDPDSPFEKLTIKLVSRPKSVDNDISRGIELDTIIQTKIISNINRRVISDELISSFQKGNYFLSTTTQKYPHLDGVLKKSGLKLLVEVVESEQIRHVYNSPRFLMGYVKFRYTLVEIESGNVIYSELIEGTNVVRVSSTKGLVVSEKMRLVTRGAIKESVIRLINRDKFKQYLLSE